jgi:hypothetical protein
MALPINPSNGQIATLGDKQFQYDSTDNKWHLYKSGIEIADLKDVDSSYTPYHNNVLVWDSDEAKWEYSDIQVALGASALKSNSYVASAGQTIFHLTHQPIADVLLFRNGVNQSGNDYVVNGKTLTYNGEALEANDDIDIVYNIGSNVGFNSELNNLDDVNYDFSILEQNDVLGWDSETQTFKSYNVQAYVKTLENRITELEGDLAQAIADRVYTDNLLSSKISDNDSDISNSGRFFVQAEEPSGGPNSGWVNTTNMKLHVWDQNQNTWVQVVTV